MFYRFVSYLETLLLKNCNIRNRHYIHVLLTLKVEVMNKMIRLSTKLKQERVKRSITQETLANYLNISKTTISKWENDLLYPDITMLPMLARFFNISVDELLNYNDSISNEEMKQLNGILNNTITDSSYEDYLNLAQIYFIDYSNEFEFLNNLLGILTNNIIYATDNPQYQESISLALEIIKTIEMNSSSIYLKKHAQGYKMILYMYQRDYGAVIEGVPDYDLKLGEQVLLATSYKQSGQLKKARSVLQTDMYQHLMNILYELMVLLMHEDLHVVPIEDFESKVKNLNKAFNIDYL
ncbi:XRE family transcriptional regulator, partial [Staphylococcus condimenti]